MAADVPDPLVLGPVLRHVGATTATLWVQTRDDATVTVRADGRSWSARTFAVHGHHYALVQPEGLPPGSRCDYTVEVDGQRVWPSAEPEFAAFPPSRLTTIDPQEPTRMAFGSCRTSAPHDARGNAENGVDALHAYALRLARTDPAHWPHLVCFLGDQVYADDTSEEMRAFIASRRDITEPPGEEIKDYDEYAHLYRLAWGSDAANR
jgi:phosphodiesterase/alkaline phosphatase D-like protein